MFYRVFIGAYEVSTMFYKVFIGNSDLQGFYSVL